MKDIVYKYRDWGNNLHRRMLTHNEIFLASPSSLNDLFDSRVPIRFDGGDEHKAFEMALRVLRHEHPELDDTAHQEMARKVVALEKWKDPEHIEIHKDFLRRKIDNDFGVCSFSARRDINLAWTHYGANHCGFCVGFDSEAVINHFRRNLASTGLIADFYQVKYVDEFPYIDGFEAPNSDNLITVLSTKGREWEYEDEVRLILITGTNQSVVLEDAVIHEVILGVRMPDEFKKKIIQITKSKDKQIQLFQERVAENSFQILIEQIRC